MLLVDRRVALVLDLAVSKDEQGIVAALQSARARATAQARHFLRQNPNLKTVCILVACRTTFMFYEYTRTKSDTCVIFHILQVHR